MIARTRATPSLSSRSGMASIMGASYLQRKL
jgi:hypothetical protein